jgi:ATP-dependent Clp protease ATP-binding subunit ClpC
MFERFTDRARKVLALANQEAVRLNHEYIGTEHILLGLVKEGSGVGANILKNLDVDLHKVRLEVEKLVKSGCNTGSVGKLPQTPRAKQVIEFAIEESKALNHNYVGSEHVLLGLLRVQEGVAAKVLIGLGLDLARVRQETLNLFGVPHAPARPAVCDNDRSEGSISEYALQRLLLTFLELHKEQMNAALRQPNQEKAAELDGLMRQLYVQLKAFCERLEDEPYGEQPPQGGAME